MCTGLCCSAVGVLICRSFLIAWRISMLPRALSHWHLSVIQTFRCVFNFANFIVFCLQFANTYSWSMGQWQTQAQGASSLKILTVRSLYVLVCTRVDTLHCTHVLWSTPGLALLAGPPLCRNPGFASVGLACIMSACTDVIVLKFLMPLDSLSKAFCVVRICFFRRASWEMSVKMLCLLLSKRLAAV